MTLERVRLETALRWGRVFPGGVGALLRVCAAGRKTESRCTRGGAAPRPGLGGEVCLECCRCGVAVAGGPDDTVIEDSDRSGRGKPVDPSVGKVW